MTTRGSAAAAGPRDAALYHLKSRSATATDEKPQVCKAYIWLT